MGVSDVNWLLAALVQSGAAIVAIVGGFAAARFVGLHAEQNAARHQLSTVEFQLESARGLASAADRELRDLLVADLFDTDTCYEYLAQTGDGSTLDGLLDYLGRESFEGLLQESLSDRFELIRVELDLAVAAIAEGPRNLMRESEWSTYRRLIGATPRHEGVWEWIYHILRRQQIEAERAARRAQHVGDPFGSVQEALEIDPILLRIPPSVGSHSGVHARLATAKAEADARVVVLQAEERALMKRVAGTGQPEGMGLAIEVLALLSVLTILVPLVPLTLGPEHLPLWIRLVVACSFALGVVSLMAYLMAYAKFLSGTKTRVELPTHVWALPPFLWRRQRTTHGSETDAA